MEHPEVYADLTFLINLTMDFLILWATGKLSGAKLVYLRLFAASFLGAAYAVGYLFYPFSIYYSIPIKILVALLLVMIGLRPRDWESIRKCLLYFFGISFMSAGAVLASAYLMNDASFNYWWKYWSLLGGGLSVVGLGYYGGQFFLRKIVPALLKYRIDIHFGNRACSGEGFLDTGNSLKDPITHRPVVIAEYQLIKDCLPEDCQTAIEKRQDETDMLQALSQSSWGHRLRLIPYSSIGQRNGLLVGFRCDEIVVDPQNCNLSYKNLTIGVYLDQLSSQGDYQLLIPSQIMQ